jgi:hypothetical protein
MKKLLTVLVFVPTIAFAQNAEYFKSMGNSEIDNAFGITTDFEGNIISCGSITDEEDTKYSSQKMLKGDVNGKEDIFIKKTDGKGNLLWGFRIGGKYLDQAYAVATDAQGNVFVTGCFRGIVDFDPGEAKFELEYKGASNAPYGGDIFIASYTKDGIFRWANGMGGKSLETATSIAVSKTGEVIIGGFFHSSIDFGSAKNKFVLNDGTGTAFTAKYKNTGEFVWANNFGGGGLDNSVFGVNIDKDGNVYAVGFFKGESEKIKLANGKTAKVSANGDAECFLIKYDKDGVCQWINTLGGDGFDVGRAISINDKNEIIIVGDFNGKNFKAGDIVLKSNGLNDVFFAKFDTNGKNIIANNIGGPGKEIGFAVATGNGHFYVSGGFRDTNVDFNPDAEKADEHSSYGEADVFVSKFTLEGVYVDTKIIGGSDDDDATGLAYYSNKIYGVGKFKSDNLKYNFARVLSAFGDYDALEFCIEF